MVNEVHCTYSSSLKNREFVAMDHLYAGDLWRMVWQQFR